MGGLSRNDNNGIMGNAEEIPKNEDVVETLSIVSKIIQNPDVSITVRRLFMSLLQIINEQAHTIKQLKNFNSIDAIQGVFSRRNERIKDRQIDIISRVQGYLTKEHNELFYFQSTDDSKDQLRSIIFNYVRKNKLQFEGKTIDATAEAICKSILGWDVLDDIMNDTTGKIEEIQIDDFKDVNILVKGEIVSAGVEFSSPEHLRLFVDKLVLEAGKSQTAVANVNEKNPFIRVRVGDSTRVSIMGGGVARRGPNTFKGEVLHVCIRKQKSDPITVEKLINWGSINDYGCMLLQYGLSHGVSVCAFGGTGSGKTASLRAFFEYLPNNLRVITMAETDEMNLRKLDTEEFLRDSKGEFELDDDGNKIRNPNFMKSINSVLMWEMPDLEREIMPGKKGFVGGVNASLTFTPDMIILQESKGGEIKDVIEEAISGHQVCTTIHVNDSKAVPLRILLMFQQSGTNLSDNLVLKQVPEAFPWVVQFKRLRDGSRKIFEISELRGFNITTGDTIIRPLLKYEILSTVRDEVTGKYTITGEHKAVFDPTKGKGFEIMKENGLTDAEIAQLKAKYEQIKPNSTEFSNFKARYQVDE